ncbi:protein of unknown function [Chitinophaga jiangningensis]|uniref:DUF4350 domain-containing protein n=1 Tax=Chitinophaga jiangningensis TaxID=1419482 RepID=A0A1M7FU28_9BACT|nr:DUF4350 domain-containing protein [Chitinophaga jiangningensis]SHM07415.1 protein of unknown function [Chitinophaga jiangningensis]
MSKKIYYIAGVLVAILLVLLIASTMHTNRQEQQSTDMSKPTFSSKDTKAGGGYAAAKLLPSLFANKPLQIVTKPFSNTYKKESELHKSGNVYIIVANELFLTENDINNLLAYVNNGNELFIAVNKMDPALNLKLGLVTKLPEDGGVVKRGSQAYLDTLNNINVSYRYAGPMVERYFTKADTSITRVIGYSTHEHPNFVRIRYGQGRIFVLLNPYTFTNYFVLHNNNTEAFAIQMSYLDQVASNIYWDDFYNTQKSSRNDEFSEWQVLLRYPAIRWALWLTLALMLLYVLFESKRRQRVIPMKPVVANSSLEFVDAIGELYYQQQDHANIAHKMMLHVLEYIRNRYYINTNQLDASFAELLAHKSGAEPAQVARMVRLLHNVQTNGYVDSEFVRDLYRHIQLFYINTK